MALAIDPKAEWLEADGLGGFASGTACGIRTRRYHALLLVATTPPTGRYVLVNGLEVWIETAGGRFALSSQAYTPDVVHPDGAERLATFGVDPWPHWRFALEDGTRIEHELLVPKGTPVVALRWRRTAGAGPARLVVRPLLSGRDYHALHHENPAFHFDVEHRDGAIVWRPYPGVPGVLAHANAVYEHAPLWYRGFLYDEERARGLDACEDLASPGTLAWSLEDGDAVLLLAAADGGGAPLAADGAATTHLESLATVERRRRAAFPSALHRAADAYLVRRGSGQTIVAGYPWFTDWGRDTFIALRGLCLATGRLDEARDILLAWADAVADGMLPNRFPDHGEVAEFNSVDAALWYVVAVDDFVATSVAAARPAGAREQRRLRDAVEAILTGYARGTRYGIRLDDDGLLAAGEPGVQLTWMDAKVGDWVVTPRIGKPVEVEALWLNALRVASEGTDRWGTLFTRGLAAFRARFWNERGGYLHDVVDPDHRPGTVDASFRPNQILAVGGLPHMLLDPSRARHVVEAVELNLLTPLGLRSLAPSEPGYAGRYVGGVRERDAAYHQGTVWPWLIGPFVEAWVRVHGDTPATRRVARARYLEPLLRHVDTAGLGHLPEIADGDPPHRPRGCPFQAWSVGEALRLAARVLAVDDVPRAPA